VPQQSASEKQPIKMVLVNRDVGQADAVWVVSGNIYIYLATLIFYVFLVLSAKIQSFDV
jgi:hypothetical protein